MNNYSIIFAADLPSSVEIASMVRQVASVVDGVKVGVAAILESGAGILAKIRDCLDDKPLLVDLKIADIGFPAGEKWDGTNAKIIGRLERSGATHVTVHGFPGPVSIAETVNTGRDAGIEVLLLPLMSHAGAGLLFSSPLDASRLLTETATAGLDLNFPENLQCADVTEAILILGEALGVYGYIGPLKDDVRRTAMKVMNGTDIVGFTKGLISSKKQLGRFSVDLTVASISKISAGGSLDFGGGEYREASATVVEPVKKSPDEPYGWWNLEAGNYVVRFNESIDASERSVIIILPHERLTAAGASHGPALVEKLDHAAGVLLPVGAEGLAVKENARLSKALVTIDPSRDEGL